jgi:CspA family cold shock protein
MLASGVLVCPRRTGMARWGNLRTLSVAAAFREKKGSTSMPRGTVKWFNPTKGYGFIAPETGGKDIFVHISAVQKAGLRTLNEGQKLGFEIEQQQNGRSAAVNLATGD